MDEIRQHCLLSNDELCHAIFGALSEIASVALLKVFRHNVSLIKNPSKVSCSELLQETARKKHMKTIR